MTNDQFQSRKQWGHLPSEGKATVIWWKITDGKTKDQLKTARIFIEVFVEETNHTRAEQEKTYVSSLKGYGAVVSRREYTLDQLRKKL